MKRCLAFVVFFLVACQLVNSQAVLDDGLNGDVNRGLPHEDNSFENSVVKQNEEDLQSSLKPDDSRKIDDADPHTINTVPLLNVHMDRLNPGDAPTSKPATPVVETPEKRFHFQNSLGSGIIPEAKIPDDQPESLTVPESSRSSAGPKRPTPAARIVLPRRFVQESQESLQSIPDKPNLAIGDANDLPKPVQSIPDKPNLAIGDANELPKPVDENIAQSIHHIQEVDNGYNDSNDGTSTMAPLAEQPQTSPKSSSTEGLLHPAQPIHHIQEVDNGYVGDRRRTSTSAPHLAEGITPKPIAMLDSSSKSSTIPSESFQPTARFIDPALLLPKQSIDGDREQNKPKENIISDNKKTTPDTNIVPGSGTTDQEIQGSNRMHVTDAILSPFEASDLAPSRFDTLESRHFDIRRRKRSMDENAKGSQLDYHETKFPDAYIWGVIGWGCFVVAAWLYINEKFRITDRIRKLFGKRKPQEEEETIYDVNTKDLESGLQENPDENQEIAVYERKGRNPSGQGIVRIYDDAVELVDESFVDEESVQLTKAQTPVPMRRVLFLVEADIPVAELPFQLAGGKMGGFQRRATERVKVIRRLSSSGCVSSLQDQILLAKDVIMDTGASDGKVIEKRKVIREVTANERRGSLLEEIEFARSVILPSVVDKEQDEEALHRRQQIKEQTSNRRMSLLENITLAKEVLGVANEVSP